MNNSVKNSLLKILDEMDVPLFRKELTLDNLHWLKRNLACQNFHNPSYAVALHFINHLIFGEEGAEITQE